MSQQAGPLSRFRVLDLSRVRSGPTCARFLADFGAEVIRIESPAGLDPNESVFGDRESADFQNLQRNKKAITLNLKDPQGQEILKKLVATADVVIENWRPGVKKRLGLDYDTIKKINPRVILASISGFGQDGPYANRPGFDQIIQGMGGLMSVTGLPGQGPVRAGIAVSDSSAGLFAALGVLTALLEREQSGEGQWVQSSLLHSMIAMMDFQAARYLIDHKVPGQAGNDHPLACPMGLFQAQDGVLNLGASGEANWKKLCKVVGHEEWIDDPRFSKENDRIQHRSTVNDLLNQAFSTQTVAFWTAALNEVGVPAGPVYTLDKVFADPHVQHIHAAQEVTRPDGKTVSLVTQPTVLSRTPAAIRHTAPASGEQTDEILHALHYSDEEIQQLKQAKII